jgi:hypothetical protein
MGVLMIKNPDYEASLERDTKDYLRSLRDARRPGALFRIWLEKYVGEGSEQGLLGRHMRYALDHGRVAVDRDQCNTLVLLVGHSVEPLLQSIWAHEPHRLVLIFSPSYFSSDRPEDRWSGQDYYDLFKELLRNLPTELRKDWWHVLDEQDQAKRIPQHLKETTPAAVFQELLRWVRNQRKVVIDITGAKKSMAAGAFLYAAYADVSVSYVDYDDEAYQLEFRAPFGYLCHIRHFSSPYRDFALRDWEQVQQLYQRYHFREARRLLMHEEGIIAAMEGRLSGQDQAYFVEEQIEAARTLAEVLAFYELWDAGDFQGAWEQAQDLKERGVDLHPLPTRAVQFYITPA